MAITNVVDYTTELNLNYKVVIDTSGWDSITAHAVSGSSCNTYTSNDGGEITGSVPPNTITATNFIAFLGVNLNDGSPVGLLDGNTIAEFTRFGKYIQIGDGSTSSCAKLIVKFHKIG